MNLTIIGFFTYPSTIYRILPLVHPYIAVQELLPLVDYKLSKTHQYGLVSVHYNHLTSSLGEYQDPVLYLHGVLKT